MSLSSSSEVPAFSSSQDEIIYWKNRSQQLEAENHQLKSKRCKCENDQDPVKKGRYDNELDPFKLLPPHCQEVILNQLGKIDIFYMTKVSNYWKLIVESDKGAAAKFKEALTLKTKSVEDLRLLNDASFKYAFLSNETIDLDCLSEFSASLEEDMERFFAIRLQKVLGKMPKLEHFVFVCPRRGRIHIWDSDQTPLIASPQLKTLQLPILYEGSIASLLLLEELTIYDELKSSDFFLIVLQNPKLKKLTCTSVDKKLMATYERLKLTEHNDNFNKNIEIIIDDSLRLPTY